MDWMTIALIVLAIVAVFVAGAWITIGVLIGKIYNSL